MTHTFFRSILTLVFLVCFSAAPALGETPHGLEPADDMPFIPDLGGLRNRTYKNLYGQVKRLSEAVVLRQSSVAEGKVTVPAGGLYYLSEVADEAAPLRGDPLFILGEHAYLLDITTKTMKMENLSLKKGEKKMLGETGYRLWFDYATDHYDLPSIPLALIAPSGHWPLEFPVSSKFPPMRDAAKLAVPEGNSGQIDEFFLDPVYQYGASRFEAKETGFTDATFTRLSWPMIEEATFSLSRPWIMDVRQEDYRLYKDMRIYTFRRAEGFLVRVTNFTGTKVLGEKLVRPATAQGYKDRADEKDAYHLTLPEQDIRIEIALVPEFSRHSDFVPWATDVPFGWTDGILSLVVYTDLVTVKNGKAWPLDSRYTVGLEANLMTGKLQRLVLENTAPITVSGSGGSISGPIKYSEVWNRPAFTVVVDDITKDSVKNYYLRDAFFQRTDNLAFSPKGRKNIDFFVGTTPTLLPILEDTFLTRLADNSMGAVVEPSHFTTHPKVNENLAFHAPDPTAPFGGLMRGFTRESVKNRRGDNLVSAEGLVIRGSYVDWQKDRIVIPPAGLYYTSRNSRNVRTLHGETFLLMGKRAYIASFEATTFVRKNFDLDFWKIQPDGTGNNIFWQDKALGVNNKVLRYFQHAFLDDRAMGMVNIVKYSGNNFGAPFIMSQNLDPDDSGNRYALPATYADGATWLTPEFIGENYMRVKDFGTPALLNVHYTYKAPTRVVLDDGGTAKVGAFTVTLVSKDETAGTVTIRLTDASGAQVAEKVLGPLNDETRVFLPQHQKVAHTLQLLHGKDGAPKVMAEMDVFKPYEDGKTALWLYEDVAKLERDVPLTTDPRFTVRLDVCGHCYQLNEVLVDNPEPIILDKKNPRFDGPKTAEGQPLFSIVVDSFDGEMIHAWHVETLFKGRTFKSENLALNPRTNVDCIMGVNGTIEGFLRASMAERAAYREYWRRGVRVPLKRGLLEYAHHKFQ